MDIGVLDRTQHEVLIADKRLPPFAWQPADITMKS
jgi:hypothetical protein